MKKLAVLLLAAGMVLGSMQGVSHAVDVNISGEWDFNGEWNDTSFTKHDGDDHFKARQRMRTQVDIVASENLSGTVQFETNLDWGNGGENLAGEGGGALGSDGCNVLTRYAYMDWTIPAIDVKVRMGLQPLSLPNYVGGDVILGSDDAIAGGVTLSYEFNENVSATLFWSRFECDGNGDEWGNNFDLFGLSIPITGDGFDMAVWGLYANMGKSSMTTNGDDGLEFKNEYLSAGLLPVGVEADVEFEDSYSAAWWVGFGGEVTALDPLRLALDFSYGRADWGESADGTMDLTREGFMISATAEYAMEEMTPGLVLWYSSGDDDDPYNGSERMPTICPSWAPTSLAWDGGYGISDCDLLGVTPTGTWGIVARLADISYIEDLSHTLAVAYYTGTNDKAMADFVGDPRLDSGIYLTEDDHAFEVNFDTTYQIYENLTLCVELGYLHLDLDGDTWGDTSEIEKDAYKIGINFTYAF